MQEIVSQPVDVQEMSVGVLIIITGVEIKMVMLLCVALIIRIWKEMKMQNKQTFYVGEIEVRIEVKPWRVRSNKCNGHPEGKWSKWMEAFVFMKNGFGVRGQSVCVPPDVFDFRFGAELALRKALAVTGNFDMINTKVVSYETRKAIWNEFNKVLPKE